MTASTIITENRVREIYSDCLPHENDRGYSVECAGVSGLFFDSDRLEENRDEIQAILAEMPEDFSGAEGGCFLEGGKDQTGNQWTKDPETIHQIFCLGIGIGEVQICHPTDKGVFTRIAPIHYRIIRL